MTWRGRSFWLALALVLYVCAAHLRAEPGSTRAWLSLVLGPMLLAFGWRLARAPAVGVDWIEPGARAAARVVAAGTAVVTVADLAPESPAFVVARVFGLGLGTTAAPVALARIGALRATAVRPLAHGKDAAIATAAMWLAAFGLAAWRELVPGSKIDALAIDYSVVAAGLGSMGVVMVCAWRVYAARRFELGVSERAAGALWLGVLCLAVGCIAALMEVGAPERIVPVCALLSAIAAASCAISQRPELVSRVLRTAASATMLATPLMCVAVIVAYKAPTHAGLILFVVTAVAVGLGMTVPRVAERLAPERGKWLRALEQAIAAAKAPEPRQAVTAALSVIRDGLGAEEGPAALYRLAARDRVVVDRAGYLHFEDAQVPPAVLERAENEADRVLSIEALRAQEVQDAQVRPIIAWLDAKGAGAAALVSDDAVPVGLLLWPAAGRVSPLAIEEVLALRSLADHLGVATGAEAELARSRARVLEAERGLGCQAGELRDLEAQLARVSYRQRAMSDLLARRVRQAAYSPAAQLALAAAERLGEQGKPIALVAPLGVDVVAWAAVVHLASPRADELMLVVDATRASEQELGGWADSKRSPLENARGGTLVILDAHVLPKDVQRLIGTSLRDDTGAIAVLPRAATAQGAPCDLDEHFTDRLGDRVLEPPGLAARVEDLRALALVALARLGMRLRGRPFGLSLEAQNLLIEHDWPANDAELEAVLVRAALATTGDVVQVEAIRRSLGAASPSAVESGPVRVAGAR